MTKGKSFNTHEDDYFCYASYIQQLKINYKRMKKIFLLLIAGLSLAIGASGQTLLKVGEKSLVITKTNPSNAIKGYFNLTDIGLMIGSTDNSSTAPFTFMTTNGYHFTEQFSGGLGIGIEFISGSYMPIVLDARYYIRNTSFSPFLSLYGGYALPLDDNGSYNYYDWSSSSSFNYENYSSYKAQGGWLLNPGFGIRKMFSPDFGIIFTVGYRIQRLYYVGEPDRQLFTDFNRLTMKIGITFR